MPVQKLNVVMLGGQGVGKSSLMAVLYNSLKSDLQNGPLILNALGGTADRLEVLYNQLHGVRLQRRAEPRHPENP